MKPFGTFTILSLLLAMLCSCTTGTYETRIAPPDAFNPNFMQYKELPGQKVLVIAVDPTGEWAFGYEHSCETLAEAAETATLKCDRAREKFKVFTKAKLFAVNNEIVYYDNQGVDK